VSKHGTRVGERRALRGNAKMHEFTEGPKSHPGCARQLCALMDQCSKRKKKGCWGPWELAVVGKTNLQASPLGENPFKIVKTRKKQVFRYDRFRKGTPTKPNKPSRKGVEKKIQGVGIVIRWGVKERQNGLKEQNENPKLPTGQKLHQGRWREGQPPSVLKDKIGEKKV